MDSNDYEFFIVESKSDYSADKIKAFFEKKGIQVVKFEKESAIDKLILYKLTYKYSPEVLIALETINDELKKKEFKITKKSVRNDFQELVNKKLEEIRNTTTITYKEEYEQIINKSFIKQSGAEGLEFIDTAMIEKQRSVMGYLIKTVGSNIMSGKSIMNVSLPINIFDCRSTTELYAYNLKVNLNFLDKAADIDDKVERLKFITCHVLTGLHCQVQQQKPFNPILGETFQATIGETHYYTEQVSHHPPILCYYAVNPKFKLYGHVDLEAVTSANSVLCTVKAPGYIELKDGTKYRYFHPELIVSGTMLGRRYVNYKGVMKIEDLTNKLLSCITLNPDTRSFFGKLFSKETYPDYFVGYIASMDDVKIDKHGVCTVSKGKELSKLEGEWSRVININEVCYWDIDDEKSTPMVKSGYIIPSDAHFREDLILLKMGLSDKSQEAKVFLEEKQRKDKKLRQGTSHHK